ncbi:MAG TPA: response regulator [Polyangiaceae bacterium]|jgi:two-component system OmpR family response regulator
MPHFEPTNPSVRPPVLAVVADDDDDARELMAAALRRAGFGVSEARDGEELVDAVRATPTSRVVVVSDIGMPRTDGIAATVALRASMPEIRIVLVTAFADGQTLRRAKNAGADRVLQKPLELKTLVDIALDLARSYQ